jgi:hypothetical protein
MSNSGLPTKSGNEMHAVKERKEAPETTLSHLCDLIFAVDLALLLAVADHSRLIDFLCKKQYPCMTD